MTDGFQSDTSSVHSGITSSRTSDNIRSSGSDHRLIIPSSGGGQTAATLFRSINQVINFERFTCADAPEDIRLPSITKSTVTADGRLTVTESRLAP